MNKTIVIGGGAAGMMAAVFAARNGQAVTLYEQNEKLGKKLFITGKGRCNVTNDATSEQLLANVISNPKFLYSAFYDFNAQDCMSFFEQLGVRLKVERGNRVFPQSDHSSDIIRALEYELRRLSVNICLNSPVKALWTEELPGQELLDPKKEPTKKCLGIILQDGKKEKADRVVLATGGVSYPLTGANGSGLTMAQAVGHKVTELYPALVPLKIQETWCHELMGLALKNVEVTICNGKKKLYQDFGEMLFTHYGVSGPLILSASSRIVKKLQKQPMQLYIDLKPALSPQQLDKRLLRDLSENLHKQIGNALAGLLPARLLPQILALAEISPYEKGDALTKEQRLKLVQTLKAVPLTITGTSDFKEAIITQGGISVKEINPSTMESKRVKGLYLAGECMDVDALTGGFNLQIAWSTAYIAGNQNTEQI